MAKTVPQIKMPPPLGTQTSLSLFKEFTISASDPSIDFVLAFFFQKFILQRNLIKKGAKNIAAIEDKADKTSILIKSNVRRVITKQKNYLTNRTAFAFRKICRLLPKLC